MQLGAQAVNCRIIAFAGSVVSSHQKSPLRHILPHPERLAGSAFLRREIASRMQERLDLLRLQAQCVLDAGCAEGDDVLMLQERYGKAQVIGVDASAYLLAQAREKASAAKSGLRRGMARLIGRHEARFLHGDFAQTSLPAESVDLLWSNLALHWHPDPLSVFREWHRLMRVEGALLFTCFGPDTFREVRAAFEGIDAHPHTLAFTDMHPLGDALLAAGFPAPVMDRETLTLTYENATDLIADVRSFGGHPLSERRRGLLSRAQGKRVWQAFEAMRREDERIHLTLEVLYGHAFKFALPQKAEGEMVMRFVPRG